MNKNTHFPKSGKRGEPVFSSDGRVIARVMPDGVLLKYIDGEKHMLHQPPAICFDICAITQDVRMGAKTIKVVDRETQTTYTCSIDYFQKNSFELKRGRGRQYGLVLDEWTTRTRGQPYQPRLL